MDIRSFFTPNSPPTLRTEDTGKIFEMAICLAYNIPYQGPFKYDLEKAQALKRRLVDLPSLFPACTHTATRGARYDFTAVSDSSLHLSAKTSKRKHAKVAPQVIGQSQPQKLCALLGIEFTDIPAFKQYIQTHVTALLPLLVEYTFDCPNLYYNEETDSIQFIRLVKPIDWTAYTYSWTCSWETWNNSATLKLGDRALVEFQFHTKSRTNMAIRWCYDAFLDIFRENLSVHTL
jgi:hypothetical protein